MLFGFFTFFLFVAVIGTFIAVFTLKIYNSDSRAAAFNDSVSKVCTDLISEAGTSRIESLDMDNSENSWHMLGISCVRRIDFNTDGKDELLVSYFKGGIYYVEVWGKNGSDFINFYRDEANSLKEYTELGSWLTVYHNGSKYYIGKLNDSEDENMDLLTLSGKEFKAEKHCRFDPKESVYIFNEEIDTSNFETIQFSALSSAKAEYQLNNVNDSLAHFINEKEVNNIPKTEEQKKASTYSKIIDTKIQKYGVPQVSSLGSSVYADGVAVVGLIDFNGDKNEELFIISRNRKDYDDTDAYPKYLTEVFAWNGEIAKKVYEGNTVSSYFDSEKRDIFYILQKTGGKTNLCFNTYSYGENPNVSWRAISSIYEMTSNDGFEKTFTAYKRKNYDYISYKLNGEYAGRYEFDKVGYTVPYFCNDDAYDKKKFTITALKCDESSKSDLENLIKKTEETIKQINNTSVSIDLV